MPKDRPYYWRLEVENKIRVLIIARNGIRKRQLYLELISLMWEYVLGDDEIDSILTRMIEDRDLTVVKYKVGMNSPEEFILLSGAHVEVVNNGPTN